MPISKLPCILAVANLLAHNNITISYYVHVNSQQLNSNVASKWASKQLWVYHLFCCVMVHFTYIIFTSFEIISSIEEHMKAFDICTICFVMYVGSYTYSIPEVILKKYMLNVKA